ncbi:MAG: flagellar basal body L-ring protein FlgH [Deltaproteobacteria bacterium]|nr:flagellar basal body L-ring protein FlgH [Deltaproteobacteria bacterium]
MKNIILVHLIVFVFSGCVNHIQPYKPKKRRYVIGNYGKDLMTHGNGSLYMEGSRGLFEDARASRVGDIILVKVEENTDATRSAYTKTTRESSTSASMGSLFNVMAKLAAKYPQINLSSLISGGLSSAHSGQGETGRKGTLNATIAVRIARILPNGDFYVEGHKVVLLNNEENHLYISGVVRPQDVDHDNSVNSWRVADAQVEFTGRGDLSDTQKQGWFARFINKIWPF